MATAAIGYVSLRGLGNAQACLAVRDALVNEVRNLNAVVGVRVASYSASLIENQEDAEDTGLKPELYLPFTGGVFPMAYFSVTYNPEKVTRSHLAAWEKKYDLRVTGRTVTALNIFDLEPPPPNPGPR